MVSEKTLVAYKQELKDDDFSVEYEVVPVSSPKDFRNSKNGDIINAISDIDRRLAFVEKEVDKLNIEIDRLTSHADGLDFKVAVGTGVLCGLIDSFFVGEFDVEHFNKNKEEVTQKFNDIVEKLGGIEQLEKRFKLVSDNLWNGAGIQVTSKTHHIDDFAHHPTLIGFFAAIIGELFRVGIFVNKEGKWSLQIAKFSNKEEAKKWFLKIMLPITLSGLLTWLIYILKSTNKEEIDKKIPKPIQDLIIFLAEVPAIITILEISKNWLGHLISDMAGSKGSADKGNAGMGIPGLFMSLFKYLSSIPPLNMTPLPKIVDDLFVNERFDLRAEIATLDQLGKQAIPVIAGDLLVRSFYFIRRLATEYKEHGDWKAVNWKNVIPFNNRTIVRMMTIESGTFTAIDLLDAAVRSAIKNAGCFSWKDFILRVNIVGVGRFAIAIGSDVGMGIKKSSLENKRMFLMTEQIGLLNAKAFYYQENMWIQIDATEKSMAKLERYIQDSSEYFCESYSDIESSISKIGSYIPSIEKKNPGLTEQLLDTMW